MVKHPDLQATLTTYGVYFAGQCVIALEEIVLNLPVDLNSAIRVGHD
jgi:hypothetical protein